MKKKLIMNERLKEANHTVVVYSENYSDLHIGDVPF